jgi:hypothetical protein
MLVRLGLAALRCGFKGGDLTGSGALLTRLIAKCLTTAMFLAPWPLRRRDWSSARLVLEEATCALDSETEAAVMKTIYTLRRDLTLLMIAHRTTTLAGCDAIYKLQGGKLLAEAIF